MSGVAHELESEHHSIDDQLAEFVADLGEGKVSAEHFRAASTELQHHIHVEEELLFPPLKAAGMIPPVLVMLREHGEIWDVLDVIERLLADDQPDVPSLRQQCERLTAQLEAHNMKEERILYPSADSTLSPGDLDAVGQALVDGDLPDGWRAEMASPPAG